MESADAMGKHATHWRDQQALLDESTDHPEIWDKILEIKDGTKLQSFVGLEGNTDDGFHFEVSERVLRWGRLRWEGGHPVAHNVNCHEDCSGKLIALTEMVRKVS